MDSMGHDRSSSPRPACWSGRIGNVLPAGSPDSVSPHSGTSRWVRALRSRLFDSADQFFSARSQVAVGTGDRAANMRLKLAARVD